MMGMSDDCDLFGALGISIMRVSKEGRYVARLSARS